MKRCICGNVLGECKGFTMTLSPCRCDAPGPGPTGAKREFWLDDISPEQYAQRKRTGLPLVAEIEKSVFREIR